MNFTNSSNSGTIDRLADIGPTHVVDDNLGRKRSEEVPQLGQIHRFKVDDDMPAKFFDAAGDLDQLLPRCEINKTLDEVEAYTTHASVMHFPKLGIADAALDRRDAAGLAAGMHERINHRAVVGTVAGGLDYYVAGKSKMVPQREQLLLRGITGSVFALRRKGKLRARSEHVAMRIHRAGRNLETGAEKGRHTNRATQPSSEIACQTSVIL